MSNSASVLGEGSYGCVHKPRLECSNNNTNNKKKRTYDSRLTKFMLTDEAINELSEYTLISTIDKKKEYYLGKPSKCKPKKTRYNLNSIKKCDLYKGISKTYSNTHSKTKKRKSKYNHKLFSKFSLLVIPDGGLDISKFADSLSHDFGKKQKLDAFWKNALHILNGIALFQKHGILHHDVKPQNIVFNTKNQHIRFIDFGFMRKISHVKNSSIHNKNHMASYPFWSYPFEFPYLNKDKYMKIAEFTAKEKQEYFASLVEKRMNDSSSKISISCHIFFDYILRNYDEKKRQHVIETYFNDFQNFIKYEMKAANYNEFLDKSIRTIDLFGVGITLQFMLCYSGDYFESEKIAALEECFFNMMRPNVIYRYTIEEAIEAFTKIMDSHSYSIGVPFNKQMDKEKSEKLIREQEKFLDSFTQRK